MYIHEGVFDYLRAARAVSPRSIDLELEEDVDCYGRNLYGYVILSTVGIASKAKSIDRIRNGEEIRTPRFTPFNFVRLLANKLSQKVQTMNGGLTIEETGACLDETDSTKIAGALILGHEIGHSQRNQAIAYLMLIVGSYMTFKEGFIDSLVPGNQLLDLTSFIGGFAMCFGGLVLSEVLADNFAKRHVEELIPYIITDEYQ